MIDKVHPRSHGMDNASFFLDGPVKDAKNGVVSADFELDTNDSRGSVDIGQIQTLDESDSDFEHQCGYFGCKPRWLQVLHNSKCLLFCLSLCTITQGIVINGLVPVSITTLEKRFHLTSTQSGLFSSMYDVAVMIILIPVCYLGNKGHKGQWLGWGILIFGIGSLVCTLPQFTTGPYKFEDESIRDTCYDGSNVTNTVAHGKSGDCENGNGNSLRLYLLVLLFGQLLHGFGASPLYTLGITYIDENVSQRASPLYLGRGPLGRHDLIDFYIQSPSKVKCDVNSLSSLCVSVACAVPPFGNFIVTFFICPFEQTFLRKAEGLESATRYKILLSGLYIAFSTIGPAFGFIIGGLFLKIYGDVGKIDSYSYDKALNDLNGSEDARWYGAWWIGYLVAACMAFLFSIPVLSFARKLPGAEKHRQKDIDQANQVGDSSNVASQPGFGENIADLPKSCWLLIKNPTWTALLVMQIAEAFLLNGFITFVPKLMENVYALSSSSASLVTGKEPSLNNVTQFEKSEGAIVVPGGFIGNVLGGFLIRKFSLRLRGLLLLAIATNVACLCLMFAFSVHCPASQFAGVNHFYSHNKTFDLPAAELLDSCNSNCSCSSYYTPVCYEGNHIHMTYYSPCYAGCSTEIERNAAGKQQWEECGCVASYLESLGEDVSSLGTVVSSGVCNVSCNKFSIFLILFGFLCLVTFIASMPVQQAVLRCVPFSQRTMAMGLSWVFIRMFGSIPGAILFGFAIDKTCTLWKTECGIEQSCLRYSSFAFAAVIIGFGVGLKLVNVISLSVGWKLYKAPPQTD